MRTIIIILISVVSFSVSAQQNLDIGNPGETGGNYGTINYVDMSALGQKKMEMISYADISGSPFWNDNWNSAILFLNNNSAIKVQKAKLNLYTSEIHFINSDGKELVCENSYIRRIAFFNGLDTTKVLAVFESFPDSSSSTKLSFYQVFNEGNIKLLELKKVFIKEKEYNPMIGAKEHVFIAKATYAVANNNDITQVKLNQLSILPLIKPSSDAYQWLKQNNNKLKSVGEVTSFLNYYNSILKK